MKNIYHIREGAGRVTESSLPEVAHLIDSGKLMFTGKKQKWDKQAAELATFRYYIRVDREPKSSVTCALPCCNYLPKVDNVTK